MEVSGMDGTDLRLLFVVGLLLLTAGIALLARAVAWLVTGGRTKISSAASWIGSSPSARDRSWRRAVQTRRLGPHRHMTR
jgi:hypothetical protein